MSQKNGGAAPYRSHHWLTFIPRASFVSSTTAEMAQDCDHGNLQTLLHTPFTFESVINIKPTEYQRVPHGYLKFLRQDQPGSTDGGNDARPRGVARRFAKDQDQSGGVSGLHSRLWFIPLFQCNIAINPVLLRVYCPSTSCH